MELKYGGKKEMTLKNLYNLYIFIEITEMRFISHIFLKNKFLSNKITSSIVINAMTLKEVTDEVARD